MREKRKTYKKQADSKSLYRLYEAEKRVIYMTAKSQKEADQRVIALAERLGI